MHRDIKPANVIVQPDGQPKLMDFGVAHVATSVMTTAGQILGSPTYMAPEQIARPGGDGPLRRLLARRRGLRDADRPAALPGQVDHTVIYRVMHEAAPPPRQWNAALPARYDDVFARALPRTRRSASGRPARSSGALDLREIELVLEPTPEPRDRGRASLAGAAEPGSASVADDGGDAPRPAPSLARGPAAEGLRRARDASRSSRPWRLAAIGMARPSRRGPEPVAAAAPDATPVVEPPARGGPVASAPGRPAGESAREARDVPDASPLAAADARPRPPEPSPTAPPPMPVPVVEGQLVEIGPASRRPFAWCGGPPPIPGARAAAEARGHRGDQR